MGVNCLFRKARKKKKAKVERASEREKWGEQWIREKRTDMARTSDF
jgi:hypothetical protein